MSTKDIVYIALFAAVTAALGLFPPFPLPVTGVPITLQSMGPMLAGLILGARRGFLSQVLFLALVAAGLPLLAGGRGGIAAFVTPTAGYLVGWAISAFVIGYLADRVNAHRSVAKATAVSAIGGILVLYACGIPWLCYALKLSPGAAIISSLWFIPGDIVKCVVAALLSVSVRRVHKI